MSSNNLYKYTYGYAFEVVVPISVYACSHPAGPQEDHLLHQFDQFFFFHEYGRRVGMVPRSSHQFDQFKVCRPIEGGFGFEHAYWKLNNDYMFMKN